MPKPHAHPLCNSPAVPVPAIGDPGGQKSGVGLSRPRQLIDLAVLTVETPAGCASYQEVQLLEATTHHQAGCLELLRPLTPYVVLQAGLRASPEPLGRRKE